MPLRQETGEGSARDRLGSSPRGGERARANGLEHRGGAVLLLLHSLPVAAFYYPIERTEDGVRGGDGNAEGLGEISQHKRTAGAGPARDQLR